MSPRLRATLVYSDAVGVAIWFPVVLMLFWPGANGLDPLGYHYGRDFMNFWFGARLLAEGRAEMLYDLAGYHAGLKALHGANLPFLNFSYPPTLLALIAPLGFLSYDEALAVWSLAGVAAAVATLRAVIGRDCGPAALLLVASPIVAFTLVIGQASCFFAALMVGGLHLRARRPLLAGVMFGLMTVKPQLGLILPLYLLWVRDVRAIGAAVATALGLVALSLVLWGAGPWHGFIDHTLPYQVKVVRLATGFFSLMMFSPYAEARRLGLAYGPAMALHAVASLAVVAGLVAALRRRISTDLEVVLVALASVTVTPYALSYDLMVPALALAIWAARRVEPVSWGVVVAVAAFWGLPFVMLVAGFADISIGVFPVLGLFVVLLGAALRETVDEARPA